MSLRNSSVAAAHDITEAGPRLRLVGANFPGGTTSAGPVGESSTAAPARSRTVYLNVLTWAFTLFSALRVACYLPTLWAIIASGDSSQHSLWTWGTWVGANLTMAAWLYEQDRQRLTRATIVSLGNAAMCAATLTVILAYRL